MAQDFYRLFGLGEDDKHINTLDPDGIALAAIKALNEQNKAIHEQSVEQEKIIAELMAKVSQLQKQAWRTDALETQLARLTTLVQTLAAAQKSDDGAGTNMASNK